MARFDLSKYDTVKTRKAKFYNDHPDGRIKIENISTNPLEYAFFKVQIFINKEDEEKNLVKANGFALEVRETVKSVNSYGKEYEGVNYTSWIENCEESAVGRALDNMGYAGTPSREEMEKVERHSKIFDTDTKQTNTQPKVDNTKYLIYDVAIIKKLEALLKAKMISKTTLTNYKNKYVKMDKQFKDRELSRLDLHKKLASLTHKFNKEEVKDYYNKIQTADTNAMMEMDNLFDKLSKEVKNG